MNTFVAIDFETGDAKRDSACAVGLVRVDCGEIVAREVRLIRPPRPILPFNYKIHGIGWHRVKNEPPFGVVWPQLVPLLDGADRLVAHNAAFDKGVLAACCKAADLDPPDLPWVCTCEMAKKRFPDDVTHKLPDVCRRLKVPIGRHHEAGADAEMCARCLLVMEGLDSDTAVARAKGLAAIFQRAAEARKPVWGFDSRTPSCDRVTLGQVPPGFDRFAVSGDADWVSVPRGDLIQESEPEEPEPEAVLFSKYGPQLTEGM